MSNRPPRRLDLRLLGAAFIAALSLASAASAATLTVSVRSPAGTPLEGVNVCACHFGLGGPDGQSRLVATNAAGQAVFTVADGLRYDILAGAQGFVPTLKAQYKSAKHPVITPEADGGDLTASIALSSAGIKNLGEVIAQVGGLTPNGMLVAEVKVTRSGAPLAEGMASVDEKGNATVHLLNVPFTPANRLTLVAYDPATLKSIQTRIDQNLSPSAALLVYSVDFPGAAGSSTVSNSLARFPQARTSSTGPAGTSIVPKKSPHRVR